MDYDYDDKMEAGMRTCEVNFLLNNGSVCQFLQYKIELH